MKSKLLSIFIFLSWHLFAGTCHQHAVLLQAQGAGKYQAVASGVLDTTTSNWYWSVNGGLPRDSNQASILIQPDTNGVLSVCLHVSDTSACVLDTCAFLQVYDATYTKTLDSANSWSFVSNVMPEEGVDHNGGTRNLNCIPSYPTYRVYTGADTMVNAKRYQLVYSGTGCELGWIREDTTLRKVWFWNAGEPTEKLMADYSGKVGDTLKYSTLYYNQPATSFVLDSITSRRFSGKSYRLFHYRNVSFGTPLVFVEGVISLNDMFDAQFQSGGGLYITCSQSLQDYFPYSGMRLLSCFSHQNQRVYYSQCAYQYAATYTNCFRIVDSCDFYTICGGIEEVNSWSSLTVTPNPVQGNTATVHIDMDRAVDIAMEVTDCNGRIIQRSNEKNIPAGSRDIVLSLPDMDSGSYLIQFNSGGALVATRKLIVLR